MKKILFIFLTSLSSIVNAQTFEFGCITESQFTVEELAEIRKVRLDSVQTLATGNTTIVRSDDIAYTGSEEGNGDLFTISYEGTVRNFYLHRPQFAEVKYGFIEDLEEPYLGLFYTNLGNYVTLAQEDYNKNSPATASNTLSTQSQAEANALTSDERYEMRTAELKSLGYNNEIQITTIKYLHRDASHVIAITLPGTKYSEFGNILTTFKAIDYGNSSLDELSVKEFNYYYNESWI